jgi:hypothetical protein
MTLKSIVLAGATLIALAAPAAAMAQPYGGYDRGYHNDRRDDWRWDRRHRWEHRDHAYGRRCFTEHRGYYGWNGRYISRPVEVCR